MIYNCWCCYALQEIRIFLIISEFLENDIFLKIEMKNIQLNFTDKVTKVINSLQLIIH